MTKGILGWFDAPHQRVPAYDPGPFTPCAYCGGALSDDDVRTINLCPLEGAGVGKSFFWRVHRTCDEADKAKGGVGLDGVMLDKISEMFRN